VIQVPGPLAARRRFQGTWPAVLVFLGLPSKARSRYKIRISQKSENASREGDLDLIKFARQEALDKVGGRVRCISAFGTVLRGANGKILAAHLEPDGYSVEVEWDLPRGHKTRVSKSEFESCLIEL
jgi:hypothetical protein